MKGIIIDSRQISWFREMLNGSYQGDIENDAKSRILGALELLLNQPQEEWVHAMNITNPSVLTFADDIAHEKGE